VLIVHLKLKPYEATITFIFIFITIGTLQAQMDIGTKHSNGVLHIKTQTKNIQGKSIQSALVLPIPDKAENLENVHDGEPAPGSLVFDQNKTSA